MPTIDQLFPGEYIKAGEFNNKPFTFHLKEVVRKKISDGGGGEEPAVVASFIGNDKKWILNKTNAVCLRAMWGDDSDAWADHLITLHPVADASGLSDSGQCIRVKGSPELDKPLKFTARLGRQQITQTLVPTKKAKAEEAAAPVSEEAATPTDAVELAGDDAAPLEGELL